MKEGPTNREAAGLVAGFSLWALAFLLLYGAHGLACAAGAGAGRWDTLARALLVAVWW